MLNESTMRMNELHEQVSEADSEWKKPLYNHIQHNLISIKLKVRVAIQGS